MWKQVPHNPVPYSYTHVWTLVFKIKCQCSKCLKYVSKANKNRDMATILIQSKPNVDGLG